MKHIFQLYSVKGETILIDLDKIEALAYEQVENYSLEETVNITIYLKSGSILAGRVYRRYMTELIKTMEKYAHVN